MVCPYTPASLLSVRIRRHFFVAFHRVYRAIAKKRREWKGVLHIMIQVQHLTLVHTKDLRTLVEDISFILRPGDKVALIGEEGNGKSTLLKWLYNPALVEGYCQWSGTREGSISMGYLSQEREVEEGTTVYDYCSQSAGFWDLSPKEQGDIARQLSFSVEELYGDQPVASLSGGEQIKLQLCRLLFDRPQMLLLDELSSDLDLETLRWLEKFMLSYEGILLYISHDETLLERTANKIFHLEHPREGKPPRFTASSLNYATYVQHRVSALAYQRQQARMEKAAFQEKMERYNHIRQRVETDMRSISRGDPHTARMLKKKMHTVQSMGRRFQREAEEMTRPPEIEDAMFLQFSREITLPAGKTIVDCHLSKLTAGGRTLAKGITLWVTGGEKIGITGRNGAGKTTLLRWLAKELLSRKDIKAAYMPQDYAETLPMDSTPVAYLAPSGDRREETRARTFLGSIRFARAEMIHPIAQLSGGQKAKLLLAKMVLDGNNVLILDEPTRNFSPMSQPQARQLLSNYGGTILSVSHDRKYLRTVCDKVYTLSENGLFLADKDALG